MKCLLLLSLVLVLYGCTPSPYRRYGAEGAQELILDSYQIHQGNFSASKTTGVTVLREIGLAQMVDVPEGTIALRDVLAAVGGIPFNGDKRCIQVIRDGEHPKIYSITWDHIVYLPSNSLLLLPGDTIFISEKPLTKWSNFFKHLMQR